MDDRLTVPYLFVYLVVYLILPWFCMCAGVCRVSAKGGNSGFLPVRGLGGAIIVDSYGICASRWGRCENCV